MISALKMWSFKQNILLHPPLYIHSVHVEVILTTDEHGKSLSSVYTKHRSMYWNVAQGGIPGNHPSTKAWMSSRRSPSVCVRQAAVSVSLRDSDLSCLIHTPLLYGLTRPPYIHRKCSLLLGLPPCILSV